jgi:hypothetical protein
MVGMLTDQVRLQGKSGVKRLEHWGAYTVIVNKQLFEAGKAGKYALVNVKECWVESVYFSHALAATEARRRSRP